MGDKKDKNNQATFFLPVYSNGVKTNRDAWCYNSSRSALESNMRRSIDFYNDQLKKYELAKIQNTKVNAKDCLLYDSMQFNWTTALVRDIEIGKKHSFDFNSVSDSLYRPYFKQQLYYSRAFNERVYQTPKLFHESGAKNRVICVSAPGPSKSFSVLITDLIPDRQLQVNGQCFPLYYYEPKEKVARTLFDSNTESGHFRRDGITDFIQSRARDIYGKKVTKEDIFYYVYGILHSPNYRDQFSSDLKKMLPRIPLVEEPKSFWKFSKAGRQLADLHIGYEDVSPAKEVMVHCTSGEVSRKEGGKIFGSGSRTPISISLLIKNPESKQQKAKIYYHDIGDYLTREEKLNLISKFSSVNSPKMKWKKIKPNDQGDWLNQRNELFETFFSIGDKKDKTSNNIFEPYYSRGVATARDAWCYNSSIAKMSENVSRSIDFYNEQRNEYELSKKNASKIKLEDFISYDSTKISWNRGLKQDFERGNEIRFKPENITLSLYRPFFKQHLYFSRDFNDMVYQIPKLFPQSAIDNRIICLSGPGASKGFSALITDEIPNLHSIDSSQCFPLYYYQQKEKVARTLFDSNAEASHNRRDGITDFILTRAQEIYGKKVTKEDIFYYVYGILHSPDYCTQFASDLKKMLPHIPLVDEPKTFWKFSKAGRELADLHIGYEDVPPAKEVMVHFGKTSQVDINQALSSQDLKILNYRVEKMRFPKKGQKDTIIYNSQISITGIPEKAYEYVVNGKSAIEWIMERYQVTTHKDSGIKNDPNDWAEEVGKPRYILDLLLSVINVSLQTVDIVNGLPKQDFEAMAVG